MWAAVSNQFLSTFIVANGARRFAVILNLTPSPLPNYRIGLPRAGKWREVLDSDAGIYGGGNKGNSGGVTAGNISCHGQRHSADFYLRRRA